MSSLRNNLDRLESRNAESIQRLNQQNNAEKEALKNTIQTLREEIEAIILKENLLCRKLTESRI